MGEVNVTENDILLKKVRLLNACKTEDQWSQLDPVLLPGEVAFTIAKKDENDILNSAVLGYKVGNGTSKWSELDYPSGDWNINAKSAETAKEAEKAITADKATEAETALKWKYDTKVYVALGTKDKNKKINARSSADDDEAVSIGVDGVLGIENGGTGQSSFTKNTVLIINNDSKMQGTSFLDVSKGGTGKQSFTENYLIVGNGNNNLKEIEILSVGHGGTGKKTFTDGFVLVGNGSSEIKEVATYSEDVPKGELTGDQAKYIVTLDALKKYSGTSSITTVGTITNGTWQGNSIGANYGGTGLTKDEIGKANAVVVTGGGDTNKLKTVESKAGAFYSTGDNNLLQFGTLKVAYGGTGSTTFTQNVPIFYNGTALESRNYFKSTIWSDGAEKASGKNVYYITDGYGVAYFKRIGLGITPDSSYVLKTSGAIYISGNTTHSGDITFSALGSIGESNKITWSGGTDAADIYYKLEANDQGALIFNMRDDTNTHFRWAYNKNDLISMDMNRNFYPNVDLNGSLGTSLNRWGSIYAGILRLQGSSSNPSATAGARIEFTYDENTNRLQPVYISYTPNDSYRQPAGLKIFGGTNATPAWLEVEGDIYANKSIRNLEVGGGIYWNPYVESAADASDAASITVLKSGAAGGTELRISQLNDAADIINLVVNKSIYMNSKLAFNISDNWLRINETGGFSSGTYFGGTIVRTDYQFQVGDGGNKFYANNSGNGYFSNTLGIGGTNTGYRLYVNGASYLNGNTSVNGNINLTASHGIIFTATAGGTTTSTPTGLTFARLQGYGSFSINADTDGSKTEYLILTSGRGMSDSTSDGLAIGYDSITWQNNTLWGKYLMKCTTVDASSLNQDTWYPVSIFVPASYNVRIEVEVALNSGTVPSWSTHSGGFSVRKIWETNGAGWGTIPVTRNVYVSTYSFTSVDPVRGLTQNTMASVEIVYVRGGGRYFFRTSPEAGTPTLNSSGYSWSSGSYSYSAPITTTAPTAISAYASITVPQADNADKIDGYHASQLWRSDGGVWNPGANITLGASANGQEWSFDITRNGHTGTYWHVWDSSLSTMLAVYPDNGRVYAPYKLAVGGINDSYTLYVNGTSHLNGRLLLASNWRSLDTSQTASSTTKLYFGTHSHNKIDSGTYYIPWFGGREYVNGYGYGNTWTSGLYISGSDINANQVGYYLATCWDDAAAPAQYWSFTRGGLMGMGTLTPSYKLHVIGDIYANGGWLRTSGNAGWYSETYGGGWYMTDSNFIRNFNSKAVSINIASNNAWGIGTHRLAAIFKGNDHVSILLSTNSLGYGLCVNNNGNWYWGKRTTSSETSTSGDTYLLQGNTTLVRPSTNMAIGLGEVKSSEFSSAYIRAVHTRHLDASGVYSGDMNLYIGYGDGTPTQRTLFYYSTGAHGVNATSRTQFAEINSNGLYALTRFGVNGQNTGYTFYVNGTSYFQGNVLIKSSSGGNYGGKLNFGDGDYVHLYEIVDDSLEIKASTTWVTGNLSIGNGAGFTTKPSYKLYVKGDQYITGTAYFGDSTGSYHNKTALQVYTDGTHYSYLNSSGTFKMYYGSTSYGYVHLEASGSLSYGRFYGSSTSNYVHLYSGSNNSYIEILGGAASSTYIGVTNTYALQMWKAPNGQYIRVDSSDNYPVLSGYVNSGFYFNIKSYGRADFNRKNNGGWVIINGQESVTSGKALYVETGTGQDWANAVLFNTIRPKIYWGNCYAMYWLWSHTYDGTQWNGQLVYSIDNTSVYFKADSFSDGRLKRNIKSIKNIKNLYLDLRPVTFTYKNDIVSTFDNKIHQGLIAQELEALLYSYGLDVDKYHFIESRKIFKDDNTYYKSINYDNFHALHIAFNQQFYKEFIEVKEIQEEKIKALQNRIEQLELELVQMKGELKNVKS